ncbi:MAG: SDR family NAD(P)-dependent oxidoreductase [Halanaerobiales bacterium]|nr:SDR family NAD(P)-dependent oxidoreductase [Halanaerobiales bacterium]
MENNIAVIGTAGKFPKADNIDQYWNNLNNGVDCITRWEDEKKEAEQQHSGPQKIRARGRLNNIDKFDASFFGFSNYEAELLDPQHRLFMECAWHAIEDAGYDTDRYDGIISIYASSGRNTYLSPEEAKTPAERFQHYITNASDFLPTRVAYKFNLRGESINIQTACSSSLVSVHMACQSLLSGNSDIALAGGSYIDLTQQDGYYYQKGMIFSPNGYCRPFDHKSNGQVDGDGVGVVVLKRLEDALADGDSIYAVIKGSALNNDGNNKAGYTAPAILGQAEVIATALGIADVPAESIKYVEAHASATPLGDPIEVKALTHAYRLFTDKNNFCAISSVKSNIGHLNQASGIAAFIKVVLSIHKGMIPGTLHFEKINPEIDIEDSPFYVCSKTTPWLKDAPKRAAVSSFGIGGTNAHIILEEAPDTSDSSITDRLVIINLSARTPDTLEKQKNQLYNHIKNNKKLNLADVAYTLNIGRKEMEYRWAAIVTNYDELLAALGSNNDTNNLWITEAKISDELKLLVRKWLDNKKVDWMEFYEGEDRKRISLPTYPFEQQRYWYESSLNKTQGRRSDSLSDINRENEITDWFFFPTWKRSTIYCNKNESIEKYEKQHFLLFTELDKFSKELEDNLTKAEISIIKVLPGKEFEQIDETTYRINHTQIEDYRLLVETINKEQAINGVIHMWNYTSLNSAIPKAEEWDKNHMKGFMSLLFLTQVLGDINKPLKIWVVTADAQTVKGPNQKWDVGKSSIFGLCKVIPQEYSQISLQCVDFSHIKGDEYKLHTEQFLNELVYNSKDEEVAYRGSVRLVSGYDKMRIPDQKESVLIRERGTYILTGGLGKIGLNLALYLAESCQANLVLVSRSGLPPEESWSNYDDPGMKYCFEKISKMRKAGAEVMIGKADVTDRYAMEKLLEEVHETFGDIHGVVHAAGSANSKDFKFIREMTPDIVNYVLKAKVQGSLLLAELLEDELSLDFVLTCSSLSPILGGITYAAYASANRFMDAFVDYQRTQALQPWISVNWDTWQFPFQKAEFGAALSDLAIGPEEGKVAFSRIISLNTSRVVLCTVSLFDRIADVKKAFKSSTDSSKIGTFQEEGALDTDNVEKAVSDIFRQFFKDVVFMADDDFFSLGGTSLEVLHLISDVENEFGIKIPLDRGFQALTQKKLSELCVDLIEEKTVTGSGEQEKHYQYELDIDDDIAIIIISESEYKKSGVPEGAKNFKAMG